MRRVLLAVVMLAALLGPAEHASARSPDEVTVLGVSREARVTVNLPAGARTPRASGLPGNHAVEVILPVDAETVEKAVSSLPTELGAEIHAMEGGTRLRVLHASRELLFEEGTGGRTYVLAIGPESEESQLRRLAQRVRRPIVPPRSLGAHLELWQEAELAMSEGNLELAKRLWKRLAEEAELADLARLRTAELYVISGHINEALEQLRSVSRDYPRSSGAALARLTALNLQAIIGEPDATPAAVALAASAGNRQRFRPFVWLRATQVLVDLGAPELALDHFPRLEQLPENWREPAKQERDRVVARAVGIPASIGDAREAVIQFRAWEAELQDHPQYDLLSGLVADAYLKLGLFEPAIPLLRRRLSTFPDPATEAEILGGLAAAYHAVADLEHEIEVVRFMVAKHPRSPHLPKAIRSLALHSWSTRGLVAARTLLASLRGTSRKPGTQRIAFAAEIDLLLAQGTPAQLVQALEAMQAIGFDAREIREPQLAMALARDGRAAQAEPRLRAWVHRTTDPERRDELAYLLADAEIQLGHAADGQQILEALAPHATSWGGVARARLRERSLENLVTALEDINSKDGGK